MSRRVVTARAQVGMLSPWRTAAEDSRWLRERGTWRYPEATRRLMDAVHAATGVRLDMEDTGGRSFVLSGRLEDGSWLTAGDADDGLNWWDAHDREAEERADGPKGWYVAIHHHRDDEHGGGWLGEEPYHIHVDDGARNHELPRVVAEALATIPRGARGIAPDRGVPRGVDYESIVNPRDDLDDDFGHIFGRLAASGHMFDWRPYDHPSGGVREAYRANLENGHYLIAHDPASSEGWSWGLFVPNGTYESRDGDVVPYDELVNGGGASWRSMARWKPGRPHSTDVLPTFEHAKAQAEDYYRRAFPLGTDTSSGHRSRPDSGVDYERLVNPRDDLGEDYGDIFGGGK